MALTLGSVSVADDGIVTKSGERGTLYDLLYADAVTVAAESGVSLPSGENSVATKKALARLATTIAGYTYALLTERAQVKVATTDAGIQRVPASTAEDTACKAPATDKFLSIV
jgi:hypothetical protein